jgi:dTDP-4-dehydrorhamnose 3,5-epimerase
MFKEGNIKGVKIRPIKKYTDERGWLAEVFREDEVEKSIFPAMSYLSATLPNVVRGPHEHVDQTDYFCFLGPSDFKVTLWDNREKSLTYQHKIQIIVGQNSPAIVIVPEGVVHAYQNVGDKDGLVINFPNQLFMGRNKKEAIDEIRHEDDPQSIFVLDLGERGQATETHR